MPVMKLRLRMIPILIALEEGLGRSGNQVFLIGGMAICISWMVGVGGFVVLWGTMGTIVRLTMVRRVVVGLSMRRTAMGRVRRRVMRETTYGETVVRSSPMRWAWMWVRMVALLMLVVTTIVVAVLSFAVVEWVLEPAMLLVWFPTLGTLITLITLVVPLNLAIDLPSCTANLATQAFEYASPAIAVSYPLPGVVGGIPIDSGFFFSYQILELLKLRDHPVEVGELFFHTGSRVIIIPVHRSKRIRRRHHIRGTRQIGVDEEDLRCASLSKNYREAQLLHIPHGRAIDGINHKLEALQLGVAAHR